ncbi:hypothetical protein Bbelb_103940 [Branchiostoma belcheri]|nr:hypothetical protein Bbelb_103940 [Branchiostoma belcheri]
MAGTLVGQHWSAPTDRPGYPVPPKTRRRIVWTARQEPPGPDPDAGTVLGLNRSRTGYPVWSVAWWRREPLTVLPLIGGVVRKATTARPSGGVSITDRDTAGRSNVGFNHRTAVNFAVYDDASHDPATSASAVTSCGPSHAARLCALTWARRFSNMTAFRAEKGLRKTIPTQSRVQRR